MSKALEKRVKELEDELQRIKNLLGEIGFEAVTSGGDIGFLLEDEFGGTLRHDYDKHGVDPYGVFE